VSRNQFESALGERFAGWNFVPGRSAGGMRQRNQVEAVVRMDDPKFAANYVFQFCTVDELHDRQSTDGNNETRLQNSNLIIHPRRTVANLIWCWNAVGASGIFAGETTADGGEIDLRSNGGFIHSTKLIEPTEECFAGRVRKRPFQRWFPRTGRLPNDHYIAQDRAAGHRCGLHPWAATTSQQAPDMTGQLNLLGLLHRRISHEGHKGTPRTPGRFTWWSM
jgi:hypothetical protein